ncbi:MAGUK p55 subfamily member 6 [Ilyodon furcidens]|uniref:MAGUK p55 subfamily member 6 n=1 Tax=Ilyodon furcidens TaxID=33524 RepID=A0ABV0U1S6_9TELE
MGNTYHFTSRTEMEADVKAGRFLEHGEYDGNLYGTKIDSIHEVVAAGRTCILDVNPQALKVLRTAEFMPYVVFIAAPDFDTLKAMHKAVVDAGLTTKQLTVSIYLTCTTVLISLTDLLKDLVSIHCQALLDFYLNMLVFQ